MSVSDLSGTKWLFNDTLDLSSFTSSGTTFNIGFDAINSTQSFYKIFSQLILKTTIITFMKKTGTGATVYNAGWISGYNDDFKTIYIIGGLDATNNILINWLELNATQLEVDLTEEYLTNKYDLTQVGNAIRKVTKTDEYLSYPTDMVSTLNNMGDFWTIEQLMSIDSLGDLYYNGSRTAIPEGAFAFKRINNVTFPNCTTINPYAFYSCSSLITASFPQCSWMGASAFGYCSKLTTISFPNCSYIGSSAFTSCKSLTSIYFSKCTSIDNSAFGLCSSLITASFPNCSSIGGFVFGYCSNLTTISFPNCTSIGYSAFFYCKSLTSIYFPECISIGGGAFQYCSSLTTISFPKCTSIGYSAFSCCTKLVDIYMPLCTRIENNAFYSCASLSYINFPNVSFISGYAFYSCISLQEIILPALTQLSGWSIFTSCYNLISFNLSGVSLVPSLQFSSTFSSTPIAGYSASAGQYGSIYVPASLYDAFKSATNWTYFSSRMVSV